MIWNGSFYCCLIISTDLYLPFYVFSTVFPTYCFKFYPLFFLAYLALVSSKVNFIRSGGIIRNYPKTLTQENQGQYKDFGFPHHQMHCKLITILLQSYCTFGGLLRLSCTIYPNTLHNDGMPNQTVGTLKTWEKCLLFLLVVLIQQVIGILSRLNINSYAPTTQPSNPTHWLKMP